jgi:hypothetical protein
MQEQNLTVAQKVVGVVWMVVGDTMRALEVGMRTLEVGTYFYPM